MKAVVLKEVKNLVVEEVPDPVINNDDDVIVKIDVCGLCGTDVHMWAGTNDEGTFPFIPGHEFVGTVVEIGKGVRNLQVGDRVTGEPFIGCKVCDICHQGSGPAFCPNHRYYGFTEDTAGGLAELHRSPEERLLKIPESVNDESAALIEAISVAYYSLWGSGGGVAPHDTVVIYGAGPIGIFAMMTSLVAGAEVILIEPAPYRQEMARSLGAKTILDPTKDDIGKKIMELTGGSGATKIVECSGNPDAIASTIDVIGVDGTIVLAGQSVGTKIPIEIGKLIWKNAKITGYAGCHYYFPHTIKFVSRNIVDFTKVVTHRYSIDDALEAFELGNKGTGSGKIMIYPDASRMPK